MTRITVNMLVLLAITPLYSLAESDPVRVSVSIDADSNFQSEMNSWVRRELRALKDVEIVGEEFDYKISVLAMESTAKMVVYSVVVLGSIQPEWVGRRVLLKKGQTLESTLGWLRNVETYKMTWLRTVPLSALEEDLKSMVAKLDTDFLEPYRAAGQAGRDLAKKIKWK